MKRSIALLTVILFCVWIVPMGAFIKPSKEGSACGGKRAICMCSNMKAEAKAGPMEGCGLRSNSNINDETSAPRGGAGHHYLTGHPPAQEALRTFILNDHTVFTYLNPFLSSIDHIPKQMNFPLNTTTI